MRGERGFTLVEVLIALALFGLMLGMIFTILTVGARTWEAAAPRAGGLDNRLVLEHFLRQRLGGALIRPDPRNVPSFQGEPQRVDFIAFPPLVIGMRGPQRFRLFQDGDRLRVRILTLDGEMPAGESKVRDLVVLAGVKKLQLRYYGDGEWRTDWTERKLPGLVEVRVETRDGFAWPPIVVALRNSLDARRGSGLPRNQGRRP